MVMVGVVSPAAAVSVVCAADTVMAVGLITWLERVAMVPNVVMGVASEALVLWPPAPARLVETVPVTVPRVVTPGGGKGQGQAVSSWCGCSPQVSGAGVHPDPALAAPHPEASIPVVPLTTSVVTAGLTAETVTGVTRRTPPIGTVRRMVPGWPGAPFSTTWKTGEKGPCHLGAGQNRPCAAPPRLRVACCGPRLDPQEDRARHTSPGSLLAARDP